MNRQAFELRIYSGGRRGSALAHSEVGWSVGWVVIETWASRR